MDLLLRLTQRRYIVAAILFLIGVVAADRWGGLALSRLDFWLHPPAAALSPLAAELRGTVDVRESARLRGLHRAVSAEIEAARAKGLDVDKLQRLADSALTLDAPAYRAAAVERLNKLRLVIPRSKEDFRPAAQGEANPDFFDPPRAKPLVQRP
ncbi:MAG: hypothetical protein HYZ74_08855 [Elusimicrobia bacterium]|nr:hypothetical protein [Elusimicrobiota bacterium]